jgi:hypothetical protein
MPWKDLASRSEFSTWPLSAHASMESAKAVQEVSPTPRVDPVASMFQG